MGAKEEGGGTFVFGFKCIRSGFELQRGHNGQGQVVWDNTEGHAYYIAPDGGVLNLADAGFAHYPDKDRQQLLSLVQEARAITLSSEETALGDIRRVFREQSSTP